MTSKTWEKGPCANSEHRLPLSGKFLLPPRRKSCHVRTAATMKPPSTNTERALGMGHPEHRGTGTMSQEAALEADLSAPDLPQMPRGLQADGPTEPSQTTASSTE